MKKFRKEMYITQRQGKKGWSFQVYIRTDTSAITRTFAEKEYGSAKIAYDSAVLFRNQAMLDIANKTVLRPNTMTVDDVFNDYIENSNDSYNTKNKHQKLYGKYIHTGNILIKELTKADIIADLNSMTETATDDTIARVLSIYRNDIVKHALNNDLIVRDLTAGLKKPESRVVHVKKSTVTDRKTILEVERLLLASNVNPYNKKIIYYLIEVLYYTGMRPAEAEVLTRDDIKENYISINKQLGSSKDDINVVTKCKTPTSVRNVPIHPQLKPILEELMDFTDRYELFKRDDGHYMDSNYAGVILCNLLRGTGIKFNLYMLRHNMATALITNGTDTKTTMEILGHSQYDMSLGYANSSDKLKDKAIKLLS